MHCFLNVATRGAIVDIKINKQNTAKKNPHSPNLIAVLEKQLRYRRDLFFIISWLTLSLYFMTDRHSIPRANQNILNKMGYGFMTVIQQYCNVQLTHQTQN